ncbi:MAG: flippase-like domain-containing protein [Bdellovibrionales bacterium]|nr:flippase-like domain-containing protein [Bdellovibrionales bacterium]
MKWMSATPSNLWRHVARLFYAAALVFIALSVWSNLGSLREASAELSWAYVSLSFVAACLGHLLNALVWWRLTVSMDIALPPVRTARAWFLSRLGRYIPGKIPLLLLRIAEYERYPKKSVALAFGLEYVMSLLSACLLVLLALALSPEGFPELLRLIALVGTTVFLLCLHPSVLKRGMNFLLGLFRRQPLAEVPSFGANLLYVAAYTAVGAVHGLSFYFMLCSVQPVPLSHLPIITGVYYGASLVGIAVLIAPAGLGVTEGMLFLVLPLIIPKTSVIIGAIAIRLLLVVADVALAGVFYLLDAAAGLSTTEEHSNSSPCR